MKRILLFGLILFLLIPALTLADKKQDDNDILMGILKDLEGDFLEGDIVLGGTILEEFSSIDFLEKLGEEIKKDLGLIGEELDKNRRDNNLDNKYYTKDIITQMDYNQINYSGYDKYKNPMTIILTSYQDSDTGNGETSLYINLIKIEQKYSFNDIIEKIEDIFKSFNQPMEITTCIVGIKEGKLKERAIENKAIKAIKRRGKLVDQYKDLSIISYTAYIPSIEKTIFSDYNRINLNLAIRYNEYENRTYFWIGTPIITVGY